MVPIPPGECPFKEIAMDLVGELPESEGFNTILVVIEQFTIVKHYIVAKTTYIAGDVADSYINNIWRLHSLPRHTTSDCGPQFSFKFRKDLNQKLNIKLRLYTVYHLHIDALSEQGVQTQKQYLHIWCQDRQNRWQA